MDRILHFKHHLRVSPLQDDRVVLRGDEEHFILGGPLYRLIAPLLDGRRTIREVIGALHGYASPPEVYYALTTLEEKGYLVEASAGVDPQVAGFWQALGMDAVEVAERLAAMPVSIRPLDGLDPGPMVQALAGAGVIVKDDAPLRVIVTDDYLARDLDGLNREAIAKGYAWTLVKPFGLTSWIGPIFRPGKGPCWECLAQRLRVNRAMDTFAERFTAVGASSALPRIGLHAGRGAVYGLAAVALSRWIAAGGSGTLDDKLLAVSLADLQVKEHVVVRRPQCGACGDPALLEARALAPLVLKRRVKRFREDGGHRAVVPEDTWARYQHHISAISGVVSDVRPVSGGERSLRQVYTALLRICPSRMDAPSEDFFQICSGKGRTAIEARVGALCEGIERYSAIFQGDERRLRARRRDLGDAAISPSELQNFSEAQHRQRASGALRRPRSGLVPPAFDDDTEIDWTPVWSFRRGGHCYVPTSYCYFNFPAPDCEQFCIPHTNGNAAGNCVEEAILQGYLELVERDAVAIWWYNRLRRPRVDLASFNEPYFTDLEDHYRAMNVHLQVLDVTHDLEIPTFVAVASAPSLDRFWIGCGCHLEPRLGVQRALTEVNQGFDLEGRTATTWDARRIPDPAYLSSDDAIPARTKADFPAAWSDDLLDDVDTCVRRAARAGLDVLVLDQTRPDVGLTVVKVMVPGLRHFWPRFGPGRLYEVPVRLGWRDRPLQEAELNPVAYST